MAALHKKPVRFVVLALSVALLSLGCETRQRVFENEFRASGPIVIAPAGASAQARQFCLDGNYIYRYQVAQGIQAGDELLRDSDFRYQFISGNAA